MENKNHFVIYTLIVVVLIVVATVFIIKNNNVNTASVNTNTASVIYSLKSFFGVQTTGTGAPSGPHYNLNIIGMSKEKSTNMTGGAGHRIFVSLGGKSPEQPVMTKILLSQSMDGTFQVLDANGTDGTASFKLPAPGTYSIWARPLGKPGGMSKMTTCAIDPITLTEVCSTSNEIFIRDTGKSSFRNVTTALTSINLDDSLTDVIAACGATTVSLFSPCLEGYFWAYDNNGLRILQLRFYPMVRM